MQAEGGFGSRQLVVGCLVSVVEFGPQQLADAKQLGLHGESSRTINVVANRTY